MSDFTTVSLQAQELSAELASSWAHRAKAFVSGLLFVAAVAFVGLSAVTVALVVGVVGAPVIAAAVAYVVLRHRRAQRVPAFGPAQ
jgi:thiamine transporter ThiT